MAGLKALRVGLACHKCIQHNGSFCVAWLLRLNATRANSTSQAAFYLHQLLSDHAWYPDGAYARLCFKIHLQLTQARSQASTIISTAQWHSPEHAHLVPCTRLLLRFMALSSFTSCMPSHVVHYCQNHEVHENIIVPVMADHGSTGVPASCTRCPHVFLVWV